MKLQSLLLVGSVVLSLLRKASTIKYEHRGQALRRLRQVPQTFWACTFICDIRTFCSVILWTHSSQPFILLETVGTPLPHLYYISHVCFLLLTTLLGGYHHIRESWALESLRACADHIVSWFWSNRASPARITWKRKLFIQSCSGCCYRSGTLNLVVPSEKHLKFRFLSPVKTY